MERPRAFIFHLQVDYLRPTKQTFINNFVLNFRVARQREGLSSFRAEQLFLERKSNVEAAATLLQAPSVSVDHLVVMGDIEKQGWMELARALRSRPDDDVIIEKLFCSRETIQKAKQDDFKVIWDRTIVCVGILHKASFHLWRFSL